MRLNRSENTKRNIIIGEIDKISGILLPFLVRTMIIHLIGAEYLGLTGLFYSILQMLNLVEMGFGTAIIYSMYQPIAQNDTVKVNALLKFYSKIYKIAGTVVAVLGLCMMMLFPVLIKDTVPQNINIYYLYSIYLLNSCINFFVFPNRKAILTAYQRDDISGRIHIVTQFGMYVAQAACIYFSKNYYLYAWMMPLSSLVYSLFCAERAKKQYPIYTEKGELDPEQYYEIKKQVTGLIIRKIAMLSRNAFDSMFVSAYLGLRMTAIYNNYYYIMDSVIMVLAVVKTSMAGGVGNSIAIDSVEKNLFDMRRINFLFMWIGGWCSICLLCLYQPFMELWAGKEMLLPFEISILFAIYFYVLKMSDIRTLYSESAGIWWQARYISIAEAATNIVLNWLLIQAMGIVGIILATLISYFIFNFIGGAVVLFQNYFTNGGLASFFILHMKYAFVTLAAGAMTYGILLWINLEGIMGLLLKMGVCMIFPNMIFFLCYYWTEDFRNSKILIKRMILKTKKADRT